MAQLGGAQSWEKLRRKSGGWLNYWYLVGRRTDDECPLDVGSYEIGCALMFAPGERHERITGRFIVSVTQFFTRYRVTSTTTYGGISSPMQSWRWASEDAQGIGSSLSVY